MKNLLTLIFVFCFLVFGFDQISLGQQKQVRPVGSAAAELNNREQDGLKGPVRRVRVETSKMIVKGGNFVEGPRAVRGIVTYDPNGKKIDAVDYPVESSAPSGNERYRYDNKGNIVEMVVVGNDGSILSKEAYEYEFDQLGNWTKMAASVAIYENGKVVFEPTEVTFRSISYYYNQAIEKLSATAAKPKVVAPRSVPPRVEPQSEPKSTPSPIATNQPVSKSTIADVKEPAKETVPVTTVPVTTTPTEGNPVAEPAAAKPIEVNTTANNATTPSVLKVSEDVLRKAAVELPQPEYPAAALSTQLGGKVEVQLLVDAKGNVINARATSGSPLLVDAAETAARKARFSPARLSEVATMVFGVITYDFVLPAAPTAQLAITPPTESRPATSDARKPATTRSVEKTAVAEPVANSGSKASHFQEGVDSLNAGRYEQAAAAFNQAIQVDPNDADAYLKLAMSYSGMHKDKEAIAGYKMAAQINESVFDVRAYYVWAGSYIALDKNSEAISALKKALKIKRAEGIELEPKQPQSFPSLEVLHHGLGISYLNSGRFGESIKELKQVITLNPANAQAHYALALAYIANGETKAAETQNNILSSLDRKLSQKILVALNAPKKPGCRTIACR